MCLSGSRGTTVRPLKVTETVKFSKHGQLTDSMSVLDLIETVYRPRSFLSVGDLQSIAGDLSGMCVARSAFCVSRFD